MAVASRRRFSVALSEGAAESGRVPMEGTVTSVTAGGSNAKGKAAGAGSGTDERSLALTEGMKRALEARERGWMAADTGRRGAAAGVGEDSAGAAYVRDVSIVDGVYGVGGATTA